MVSQRCRKFNFLNFKGGLSMKLKNGVWKKINKDLYMIRVKNEIERINEIKKIKQNQKDKIIKAIIKSNLL